MTKPPKKPNPFHSALAQILHPTLAVVVSKPKSQAKSTGTSSVSHRRSILRNAGMEEMASAEGDVVSPFRALPVLPAALLCTHWLHGRGLGFSIILLGGSVKDFQPTKGVRQDFPKKFCQDIHFK